MSAPLFTVPEPAFQRLYSRELATLKDPAIRWPESPESAERAKADYLRALDARLLQARPGAHINTFEVVALDADTCDRIHIEATAIASSLGFGPGSRGFLSVYGMHLHLAYYKAGCAAVHNVAIRGADGKPTGERQSVKGARVLEIPIAIRAEIGEYIYRLSHEVIPGFCLPASR